MNKNGSIVNVLTFVVVVAILVSGFSSFIDKGGITGFAVKNKQKVNQDVIGKINDEGQAQVIVFLKNNDVQTSDANQEIKQKQDSVLGKLDYVNERQKGKIKSSSKGSDFKLKHKYSTFGAFSGNVTSEGLAKLQSDPDVERIVPVRKVGISTTLDQSTAKIDAKQVHGLQINGRNITGNGQTICIIDTGVDYTHESLGSCSLRNVTEHKCKIIAGYDFVNLDTDPMDDNSHGTHVAGIAAANGNLKGVAPRAKIVAMKALDSGGFGTDDDVVAAIDWCNNNATRFNISVISMSLGDGQEHTSANCPTTMDVSLNRSIKQGISVFAASGNNGSTTGIAYPGCSPATIAVGASDIDDTMASFTNVNNLLDVIAPGVSIVSTNLGGGTTTKSGTSMATPHASGAAALIYQYEKEFNKRNATFNEVKELLRRSNVTITSSGLLFPRIDILRSVNQIARINKTDKSVRGDQVKLRFKPATNVENVSEAFVFRRNFISLNSSKYALYNKTSNVTFFNITSSKRPVILKNGRVCTECRVLDYTGGVLLFNVSHFTNYTSGSNAQLQIFDQADAVGGSRPAKVQQKIYFYANYTNKTSGINISTANCAINFTDTDNTMTFNISSGLYELNKTFSSSNTYHYNVTCYDTNYEKLNTTDTIFVAPACLDQTPNTDITINANQQINCSRETLTLTNQSILVYGNLIMNNTVVFMKATGTAIENISVFNKGNLTVRNVTINGTDNGLTIYGYSHSHTNVTDVQFYNIDLDLRGNTTNKFRNSIIRNSVILRGNATTSFSNATFNHTTNIISTFGTAHTLFNQSIFAMDILLEINSRTELKNSKILKNISFFDSSYTEIKNTSIREIKQLGPGSPAKRTVLNFTRPRSSIHKITTFKLNSTIYGYVDMPDTAGFFAIVNIKRFYPVQVNFTNGAPVPNRYVNVTDYQGQMNFSKKTDANGFVNVGNITFTQGNKRKNFTFKVNPEKNISLLNDTPILFTLFIDTTPPEVSTIRPISAPEDISTNYTATIADDIAVTNCNLYINGIKNGTMTIKSAEANRSVTMLTPGTYSFLANCSDAQGNYNDTSITSIQINDTTQPTWNETPLSRTIELGHRLYWNLNASDNVAVDDYGVNDTTRFKINKETGLLQNNTALSLGTFWLNLTINDTSNNQRSTIITITVQDTAGPAVTKIFPKIADEDTPINYTANATDLSGIASCNLYIGGIKNGTMTIPGTQANRTVQINTPGIYMFVANCTDTLGNYNDTSLTNVRIRDITPPTWNETPTGKTLEFGTTFRYRVNASDNVAVDDYFVNDTRFRINKQTGLLQNNSIPALGIYSLNISVNDTSNNQHSIIVLMTIQDTTPPKISKISARRITNQSAVINWTTNENANTTLNYGLTKALGIKRKINNAVILHNVSVFSLKNFTRYFYNVSSCSAGGCAENGTLNFTTKQNTVISGGSSGGGGGGGSSICTESWQCGNWSDCSAFGTKTRICIDSNSCGTDTNEPLTEDICEAPVVKKPLEEKPQGHSGILEPLNKVPVEDPNHIATGDVTKKSVLSGFMEGFLFWIILGLFLLLLVAHNIDDFPLVIWREKRYIRREKLEKAEKLFDRAIGRFGKSRDVERKYIDQIEELALNLEALEKKPKPTMQKKEETKEVKAAVQKVITGSLMTASDYNGLLKQYQEAFDLYMQMKPEQRKGYEPKLQELREKLLRTVREK